MLQVTTLYTNTILLFYNGDTNKTIITTKNSAGYWCSSDEILMCIIRVYLHNVGTYLLVMSVTVCTHRCEGILGKPLLTDVLHVVLYALHLTKYD